MKRGFSIILALLLTALLLILGVAFLSKQSHRYRLARLAADSVTAKGLALAGIETSRVKLQHDLLFPPPDYRYHDEYSYEEPVHEIGTSQEVGSYEVTIDRRWMEKPYEIIILTSVGHPRNSHASYRIRVELDVGEGRPTYYEFIRWEENAN